MKRALLVGINEYPDYYNVLQACLNDVIDFKEFLVEKCKFKIENVKTLTEIRAKKKPVINELKKLVRNSKKGDIAVFFYSGHGNRLPFKNKKRKLHQYCESICPYDFGWYGYNNITDRSLSRIFSKIKPGVKFIWVSDSCFSAGLSDVEKPINVKRRNNKKFPRGRIFDLHPSIKSLTKKAITQKLELLTMRGAAEKNNILMISATKVNQCAQQKDFKGEIRFNGLFTYYLLESLNQEIGLETPVENIINYTAHKMQLYGNSSKPSFKQEPVLHGDPVLFKKPFLKK